MIKTVSMQASTYADLPHKFEAGTPHIAGVIGLGAASRLYEFTIDIDAAVANIRTGQLLSYANATCCR